MFFGYGSHDASLGALDVGVVFAGWRVPAVFGKQIRRGHLEIKAEWTSSRKQQIGQITIAADAFPVYIDGQHNRLLSVVVIHYTEAAGR